MVSNLPMPSSIRWLAAALLMLGASAAVAGYSVEDGQILKDDRPIQLRGVNWFGFETELYAPHGLWKRNWREMIAQMDEADINAVRIPVCPDTLRGKTPGGIDYGRNPELQGLTSLEILDRVVDEFNERGMHILLDHHRPDCKAISELWYTDEYSEKDWIDDLVFLAERYDDREYFLGLDIKNEPHGKATWGAGDRATDWNRAAELAARQILRVAPHRLIFVEGVQETGRCRKNVPDAWWGGNLGAIRCTPLKIPASRLVLSPHVYGPDVHVQPYFDNENFPDNLPPIWDQHFGSLVDEGYAIVPGEFGGRYGHAGHPTDRAWQNRLVEYLRERGITSGFYWSWNPNSGDTGGLLQDDWQTLWPTKMALLNHFWRGEGLASVPELPPASTPLASIPDTTPRGAPVSRARDAGDNLQYRVTELSDWGRGYCVDVGVSNTGQQSLEWSFRMPVDGRIDNLWNARYRSLKGAIEVQGVDWNARLAPGAETHFGFCARRDEAKQSDVARVQGTSSGVLSTQLRLHNRWQEGYCTDVIVRNGGKDAVAWQVTLDIEGQVNNLWRGRFKQDGRKLTVEGEHYNRVVAPGGEQSFGYCARLP